MLVRLKKRGEFPKNHNRCTVSSVVNRSTGRCSFPWNAWRGCVIEVEPDGHTCVSGLSSYLITDSRVAGQFTGPVGLCDHHLIDDLDAYESDSADEQAEIGDLAMVAIPQTVKAR